MRIELLAAGILRVEKLERLGHVVRYDDNQLTLALNKVFNSLTLWALLIIRARRFAPYPAPQGIIVIGNIAQVVAVSENLLV